VHDNVDHPISLYAATKKSNELMAHAYAHLFGMPATGLRYFTVYGPWGRPDMAPFLFARAILEGRPIDVFNHGRKAAKNFLPMQPGDVAETHADVAALERDTGFRPTTSLAEGVRRFVDWYREYYRAA